MNHTQLQTLLVVYSQLTESERRLVDGHVLHCAECAAHLRAYQQMDQRLSRLVTSQISEATRTQSRRPSFATPSARRSSAWLDHWLERLRHPVLAGWQLAGVGTVALLLVGFLSVLAVGQFTAVRTAFDNLLEQAESPLSTPTPAAVGDKVTITFACHHSSCNWFREQARVFQQQQPNIEVVIKEKGKFSSLGANGKPIDEPFQTIVASVDSGEWWWPLYSGHPNMSGTEWSGVRNLQQFIQADPTFPAEDFFPAARQYLRSEFVASLPVHIIPPLIVFDKTLFDAVRAPYPLPDWKLADFYRAAHQTTVKKQGEDCCVGFVDSIGLSSFPGDGGLHLLVTGELTSFLQQHQSATPAQIIQALTEAIQRYRDLVDAGATAHQVELRMDDTGTSLLPLIDNWAMTMWTELLAGEGTAEYRYPGSRHGFAPLPEEMRRGFAPRLGNVYYISAQSPHPQESWLWIRFLSDQVNPHDVAPPARRSTAESHYFNRPGWDAGQVAALQEALQQPDLTLEENSMTFSAIRGTLNSVIESVLKGQSVEEALGRMRPRLEQQITIWQAEQNVQTALDARATATAISAPIVPLPTPTASPDNALTVINFACHDEMCISYSRLAEEFQRQHPTIQVNVYYIGPADADRVKFFKQMVASTDAGVWFDPVEEVGTWPRPVDEELAGLLTNLAPLMADDPTFDVNDFYPVARSYLERKAGSVWSLPVQIMPMVMAYQRDDFRKAGIESPVPGWTLADFYTTAQHLGRAEGERVDQFGFVDRRRIGLDQGHHLFVLDALERSLQASATLNTPLLFPDLVDSVRRYTNLAVMSRVMPNPTTLFQDEKLLKLAYNSSGAAMWTALYGHDIKGTDSTVGVVPLPEPLRNVYSPWLGKSFYITKQSRHPQESWLWLKFLAERSDPNMGGIPARRSVAENSYWGSGIIDPEQAAIVRPLVEQPVASSAPYPVTLIAALHEAINQIFSGTPVEVALAASQPQVDVALSNRWYQVHRPLPIPTPYIEGLEGLNVAPSPTSPLPTPTSPGIFAPTPIPTPPQTTTVPLIDVFAPVPPLPTPTLSTSSELTLISFACHEEWACSQYKDLAREFERQYPHIAIDIVYTKLPLDVDPVEFFRQTSAKVDTGLWFAPMEEMGPWTNLIDEELAGMLTNLAPLLAVDPTLTLTDFYPVARSYLERKGDTVWSLPLQIMPTVIAYDRQAFRKNDVPYPAPDWTLADFYTTARQVTRYEGGQREWFGFVDRRLIGLGNRHHLFLLEQLEPFLQAQATVTGKATFPPALVDAIRRYTDLALKDGAMPNPTTLFQHEELLNFANKATGAAMWTALYGHDTVNSANSIGIAPLPHPLARFYPPWLGNSVYISKQSRHPQESWLWLKFLSEHDLQTYKIPARRSTAEHLYWSTPFINKETAAILRPLVEQPLAPADQYPDLVIVPLNDAIRRIFGGIPVETALAEAQPAFNFGLGIWRDQQQAVTPTSTAIAVEVMATTRTPLVTPTPATPSTETATPTPTLTPTRYAIVDSGYVALRSGPGVDFPQVAQLGPGIPISITGFTPDGNWYKLCCVNGADVWVATTQVRVSNDAQNVARVASGPPPTPTATLPLTLTPFVVEIIPPPTATPQPTALSNRKTVTFGCPSEVCAQFRELAQRFEQLYPAIAVKVVEVPDLLTAQELSQQADVVAQWRLNVNNAALRANFANLRRDFILNDPGFDTNDYYPGALELFQWEDGLWILPTTIVPVGILYDKTAFAQAGLPPPTLDWSRADFLAAARKLTQRQSDGKLRYGFVNLFDAGIAFLAGSLRELIVPTTGGAPDPTANAQIKAALQWYTDLAHKEQVMPSEIDIGRPGAAAMWLMDLGLAPVWSERLGESAAPNLAVGLAPLPDSDFYPLAGTGPLYLLSQQAQHPWESWLWLKFLTKQRIKQGIFPDHSAPFPIESLPARRSVAAQSGYWNQWDPAARGVVEYVLDHAQRRPWGQLGGQRWQRLNTSISSILAGTSVDEALAWLDDCPDYRSAILEPEEGAKLNGKVALLGSAHVEHFQYYKLEFAAADDPTPTFSSFDGATTPISGNEPIGMLDTTQLADGAYVLRLTVVDKNGNFPAQCRVRVTVKNR